jgi:hypothetical protein
LLPYDLTKGLEGNQFFDQKQPEAPVPPIMEVNRAIDDSINNLETLEPSLPRSEVLYHKSFSESEEDLDRLPQVGGGLATVHRRAPVFADYSDFINDAPPLSNGHQGLRAPPTWSGGPGHRKGKESSKLPGSAHLFALPTWSSGPGHWKGTESSKLPGSAHLSALST